MAFAANWLDLTDAGATTLHKHDHGGMDGLGDDDHTQYLLANGTRGLTAAWDAGSWQIRAETFQSDVATGTAPFTVASTTVVTNLNADLLDGNEASAFATSAHLHDGQTLENDGIDSSAATFNFDVDGALNLNPNATGGVNLFGSAASGETPYLSISGYPTGQSLQTVTMGQKADTDRVFLFSGATDVDSFLFDKTVAIGGGAAASELRFLEPSGSGTNYTAFKAQAQAGDVTYTLPAADGSANQVLSTNGSGTLSWATVSGGASDHGALTGLADDDHSQYLLLAGRAGGQTGYGGTAASETLTLAGTSHATKGNVNVNPSGGDVSLFGSVASGVTPQLYLKGWKSAAAGRSMRLGVGVDRDTAISSWYQSELGGGGAYLRWLYVDGENEFNLALGIDAMNSPTLYAAQRNIAIGYRSMKPITFGYDNTACGHFALSSVTSGYRHSAYGRGSLATMSTGHQCSAFGHLSLYSASGGYNSEAFGGWSLYSMTNGYENSAFGFSALYDLTTGYMNVGLGYEAGRRPADSGAPCTTNNRSTYLGSYTRPSTAGNQNELVVGYGTYGSGSNTATFGNTATTNYIFGGNPSHPTVPGVDGTTPTISIYGWPSGQTRQKVTLGMKAATDGVFLFSGVTDIINFAFDKPVDVTGSVTASTQLISSVATGTAPLTVASTTAVTNLNADLLDGQHASAFATTAQVSSSFAFAWMGF